ncbi:MAG: SAM-dependent methyltransferase [Gammaproteobacteria bacterium]
MSSYHHQEQVLAQLPVPGDLEIEHSNRLIDVLVAEIEQQAGVISFSEYMDQVLYRPGLGYYSAGKTKFGGAGDFITAPEISDLFGRTLAKQCESFFQQGCVPSIMEFGAGSGRLCAQLLSSLPETASYFIIELSADLRQRQQEFLQQQLPQELYDKLVWLDELPPGFDGIVLANEVLDAMPVHVVSKHQQWQELGVGFDGRRFHWRHYADSSDAVSTIQKIESELEPMPEGYCTEVNLNYKPWLRALQASTQQVVIMMIDYGYQQAQYYHPERREGTLICHYRHRAHPDPLVYPGLQDITAFVDFDAFAVAAIDSGFEIGGFSTQGHFLLANGLLDLAAQTDPQGDTLAQLDIAQQVKTLTLPAEMGEKFKVLCLQKNLSLDFPALASAGLHG